MGVEIGLGAREGHICIRVYSNHTCLLLICAFLAYISIALDPNPDPVEPRRYYSPVLYGIGPPVHFIDVLQVVCSTCQGGYIADRFVTLVPVGFHSESAGLVQRS